MPLLIFALTDPNLSQEDVSKYVEMIDVNKLRMDVMKDYLTKITADKIPWATNDFLRRMSLTPSIEDVKRFGIVLHNGVDQRLILKG